MKFIGGVFSVLKHTTWPTRKQSWHDFISILEYSAFFAPVSYTHLKKNMSPIKVMLLLVVIAFVGVITGFFDPGLKY